MRLYIVMWRDTAQADFDVVELAEVQTWHCNTTEVLMVEV